MTEKITTFAVTAPEELTFRRANTDLEANSFYQELKYGFCFVMIFSRFYLFSCGSRLRSCETVPTVAAVYDICRFRGVPKVQPAEDMQTMTHWRLTISLVVRVISRSKNNFYDVIRLKIIESRYFPKQTVKVGLEKIKQNGGQLKATKCR